MYKLNLNTKSFIIFRVKIINQNLKKQSLKLLFKSLFYNINTLKNIFKPLIKTNSLTIYKNKKHLKYLNFKMKRSTVKNENSVFYYTLFFEKIANKYYKLNL